MIFYLKYVDSKIIDVRIEKIRPQITEGIQGIHAINTICVRLSPVAGGSQRNSIFSNKVQIF